MTTIVALGANLGERELTFRRAIAAIGSTIGPVVASSRFYDTKPLVLPGAVEEQPPYLNAVIAVVSGLPPLKILAELQQIERDLGRDRAAEEVRWGPRIIDLDIIAIGDTQLAVPGLTIPHPEMHKRRFVLEPLLEVAPDWIHPTLHADVAALLAALPPDVP